MKFFVVAFALLALAAAVEEEAVVRDTRDVLINRPIPYVFNTPLVKTVFDNTPLVKTVPAVQPWYPWMGGDYYRNYYGLHGRYYF